jgi:hypothetical protein
LKCHNTHSAGGGNSTATSRSSRSCARNEQPPHVLGAECRMAAWVVRSKKKGIGETSATTPPRTSRGGTERKGRGEIYPSHRVCKRANPPSIAVMRPQSMLSLCEHERSKSAKIFFAKNEFFT